MKKKIGIILLIFVLIISISCCFDDSSNNTNDSNSVSDNVESEKSENTNQNNVFDNDKLTSTESAVEHIHSYIDATCTTPKKCSCGQTNGEALGHNWKSATCSTPKKCSVCKIEIGTVVSHKYTNGICSYCGKKDTSTTVIKVWIPTNGGTKYHSKSTCSNMNNPKQVTKSQAESQGFTACKRCH